MGKQKQFIKQLVEKLRTDSGGAGRLVELTKHRTNRIRIGRDMAPRKDHTPYLGVAVMSSIPVNEAATSVQVARVRFISYAREELTAFDIADRIETLLDDASGTNRSFYDFSGSSAGEVSTRSSRFKTRGEPDLDAKTEVWSIFIEADVIWDASTCPSP